MPKRSIAIKGFRSVLLYTFAWVILFSAWKVFQKSRRLEVTDDILEFCDKKNVKEVFLKAKHHLIYFARKSGFDFIDVELDASPLVRLSRISEPERKNIVWKRQNLPRPRDQGMGAPSQPEFLRLCKAERKHHLVESTVLQDHAEGDFGYDNHSTFCANKF